MFKGFFLACTARERVLLIQLSPPRTLLGPTAWAHFSHRRVTQADASLVQKKPFPLVSLSTGHQPLALISRNALKALHQVRVLAATVQIFNCSPVRSRVHSCLFLRHPTVKNSEVAKFVHFICNNRSFFTHFYHHPF